MAVGLFAAKILATLFAVFVYSRYVTLGDSGRYLNAQFSLGLSGFSSRTAFTDNIYAAVKLLVVSDTLVHLTASLAVAVAVWYVFRRSYAYANKADLWACLLLPHFLIWSGVVAKEPIAIVGFLLMVKACVDISIHGRTNLFLLVTGGALGVFMRPHYGIAYGLLLAVTLFLSRKRSLAKRSVSTGHWLLATSFFCVVACVALWSTYSLWADEFYSLMERARDYFVLYDGRSNRYDIQWYSAGDYFRNAWWGIPVSIIGPTFSESVGRVSFIPVFLEGLFALYLVIRFPVLLLRFSSKAAYLRPLVCFGFIPALIVALLAHYLLGVFNPGSAIRYKQSLAPLLYFYPILLIAEVNARNALYVKRHRLQVSKNS